MKKRFWYVFVFFAFVWFVTAAPTSGGGQGSQGGTSSGGAGTSSCASGYFDVGPNMNSTTYLFDLVYRPKNSSNYEHIACSIIGPEANNSNLYYDWNIHKDCTRKSLGSYNNNTEAASNLSNIAKYLSDGKSLSNLNDIINKNSSTFPWNYLGDLGVSKDKTILTKYKNSFGKDNTKAGGNYGYRILIQKFNYFGCASDWTHYIGLRKEINRVANPKASILPNPGFAQRDLYTDYWDIGITKGSAIGDGATAAKFEDKNDGTGYNIIWFDGDQVANKYNYSIDAACEGCDGDNDKGSYYVQDTTNWKSIQESTKNDNANVKKHFNKGNGVLCREEYKIEFPNSSVTTSGKIAVDKGSYFTVGLDKLISGHPNLEPIKVTRLMQCKGSYANLKRLETSYKKNHTAGGVNLCYLEGSSANKIRINGNKYSFSDNVCSKVGQLNKGKDYSTLLHFVPNSDSNTSMKEIKSDFTSNYYDNNTTLNISFVSKYVLPDNLYRYISKNGQSQFNKPANTAHYTDAGAANLPVSLNSGKNNGSKTLLGAIKLQYKFPENNYSYLGAAFNAASQKAYFGADNVSMDNNVYKTGSTSDEKLEQTSCAKLFGMNSAKYNTCVAERKGESKTGTCKSLNGTDNTNGGYVCPVNTKGSCVKKSDDTCEMRYADGTKEPISCKSVNDGQCLPDVCENGKCEDVCENGKCEHVCEKVTDNLCRIYGVTRKGVRRFLEEGDCSYYEQLDTYKKEGCIPSSPEDSVGNIDKTCVAVDLSADKCKLTQWKNGTKQKTSNVACSTYPSICPCKGTGCPNGIVIYRTIDLDNPFPNIDGKGRDAGSNWCSYDASGNAQCKLNNSKIIKEVITNNRDKTTEDVYTLTPMYTFEIGREEIKSIKTDNSKLNGYSEFTLDCNSSGQCVSKFVRQYADKSRSACVSATGTDFYNCRGSKAERWNS